MYLHQCSVNSQSSFTSCHNGQSTSPCASYHNIPLQNELWHKEIWRKCYWNLTCYGTRFTIKLMRDSHFSTRKVHNFSRLLSNGCALIFDLKLVVKCLFWCLFLQTAASAEWADSYISVIARRATTWLVSNHVTRFEEFHWLEARNASQSEAPILCPYMGTTLFAHPPQDERATFFGDTLIVLLM